ncbi:alpha/beta fold hydrolase [Cohnella rhizosphaerae]|uniref:Alpha/beta hydrolase n=1 Tax=Cohnella rhizosphaerae TaxID=1457232 RepID=A0A9X4QU25_9BACL|nr:alpha/beta hydrolase [Cohnella rhizosphaerae]MDG0811300.1 alpha/beta hydrolase [Cohnella rhizosphaerae]
MYPYYPEIRRFPCVDYRYGQYGQHALQRLTFVLVHGAWADARFWDDIAAALRANGHVVYTPEYAGHGEDPNKQVTHAMITQSVVDFITKLNLRDIVLVGHSFGGTVVQKAAEQVSARLKRLVFWDAFVLKDGESLADEVTPQTRQGFEQLRASSGGRYDYASFSAVPGFVREYGRFGRGEMDLRNRLSGAGQAAFRETGS